MLEVSARRAYCSGRQVVFSRIPKKLLKVEESEIVEMAVTED